MTPKERAAMQQALEALEICNANVYVKGSEAITALREALVEQAEQEPVVNCSQRDLKEYEEHVKRQRQWLNHDGSRKDGSVEYAAPIRTKDLTDDEIAEALKLDELPEVVRPAFIQNARAVIAADREKNNPLTKSNTGE